MQFQIVICGLKKTKRSKRDVVNLGKVVDFVQEDFPEDLLFEKRLEY